MPSLSLRLTRWWIPLAGFCIAATVVAAQTPQDERSRQLEQQLRTGQYADAVRTIDAMLRDEPRDDLTNVRAVFARQPNMRVRHGHATITCEVSSRGVRVPLTVNDRRVDWLADTGLNVTTISDAEARMLGLEILDANGRLADLAGGTSAVRTAVARNMVIAGTRFENVTMLVMPADQMPWTQHPEGRQGMLGLPVLAGLEVFDWTRRDECSLGRGAASITASEGVALRFDALHLIAPVDVDGHALEFILDSGNQAGTQLWERFGKELPDLVAARGRPGTARVTQLGGANDRPATLIRDLELRVGSWSGRLDEAVLLAPPVGDTRFHGLLGTDILSQADHVTIDFAAMRLVLR